MNPRYRLVLVCTTIAMALSVPMLGAADVPAKLPRPDGMSANQTKPVQVFIMMGQSNMLGFGRVSLPNAKGTLDSLVKEKGKYANLVDDKGEYLPRNDVRYVHVMHNRGKMQVMRNEWLIPKGTFGPELGFGQVIGTLYDEPVLLLKSCIGNRSLGWDLLPPGSKQFEYEGKIYAGYKESPGSWAKGTQPMPIEWYAGKQYDDDIANAKKVLANLAEYYPGYKGQGYEMAGFVWWQGHKDQNPAHASRYEQNLVHLIQSLRKDFDAPNAKFVLATIAFGGDKLAGPGLTIAKAQLAVDGASGNYPDFKGTVAAIDARPFWRAADESPNARQDYHYFHNAETYMEVGDALGRAMANLSNNPKK